MSSSKEPRLSSCTYNTPEEKIDNSPSPKTIPASPLTSSHQSSTSEPMDIPDRKGPFSSTSPPQTLYYNLTKGRWATRKSTPHLDDYGKPYTEDQPDYPIPPDWCQHPAPSKDPRSTLSRSTQTMRVTTVAKGSNT